MGEFIVKSENQYEELQKINQVEMCNVKIEDDDSEEQDQSNQLLEPKLEIIDLDFDTNIGYSDVSNENIKFNCFKELKIILQRCDHLIYIQNEEISSCDRLNDFIKRKKVTQCKNIENIVESINGRASPIREDLHSTFTENENIVLNEEVPVTFDHDEEDDVEIVETVPKVVDLISVDDDDDDSDSSNLLVEIENKKPSVFRESSNLLAEIENKKPSVLQKTDNPIVYLCGTEYMCKICLKTFKRLSYIKRHIIIHEETTYNCHLCDLKTKHKKYVRIHYRKIHNINIDLAR